MRGISVKKLAKHVYNHYCTLFYQPDFVEIYRYTQNFVQRNSRSQRGIIEHAEKWGYYRLNLRNASVRQMMQEFAEKKAEKEEKNMESAKPTDLSLSLFGDV